MWRIAKTCHYIDDIDGIQYYKSLEDIPLKKDSKKSDKGFSYVLPSLSAPLTTCVVLMTKIQKVLLLSFSYGAIIIIDDNTCTMTFFGISTLGTMHELLGKFKVNICLTNFIMARQEF